MAANCCPIALPRSGARAACQRDHHRLLDSCSCLSERAANLVALHTPARVRLGGAGAHRGLDSFPVRMIALEEG